MYWYETKGKDNDIFVSTRVRLARNIEDYPFDGRLSEAGAREIADKVRSAFENDDGYSYKEISSLAENEKLSMVEKHIISPEAAEKKTLSALVENKDEGIYIMLCEEDHIRIQAIKPGFDLKGAMESAFEADDKIDSCIKIAFDEKLGYLTHCPTNLGTGMRASVMMFLPALTMSGKIKGIQRELSQLGLTVRGITGEGSAAKGCLYQFSNCVTLGLCEEEIIENLNETVKKIADTERHLRESYKKSRPDELCDKAMRALGCMKYAHMISTQELYNLYADVRLGISLGIINNITEQETDALLISCMPATLTLEEKKELTPAERDVKRAQKLKTLLK